MEPRLVHIGLGANIEPEHHTRLALAHLARQLAIVGISRFYRTEPIGRPGQPEYLNGVVLVRTDMSAHDVKYRVLRPIETALGRIRSRDPYAPRPIDLDIVLCGAEKICEAGLVVPDPDLQERVFLAAGVLELSPDARLPGMDMPLAECVSAEAMAALVVDEEFSREMRERYSGHE